MFFTTTRTVQVSIKAAWSFRLDLSRLTLVSLALVLLLLSLAACDPLARTRPLATPDPAVEHRRAFVAGVERLRVQYHIPGISLAVVQGGEIVEARGFGYADLTRRTIATERTTYPVASLTKPIAATIIMQLVEEGRIDLDAPFARYDPDYASLCAQLQGPNIYGISNYHCATRSITVRHHLTHTAQGDPGTTFIYHSGVYGLLARVVARVTGTSFEQALDERIITPLQMNATAAGQGRASPEILAALAQPYRVDVQGKHYVAPFPVQNVDAAAGIVSNVLDMATFSTALDQNLLVSEESRKAMWTPARSADGRVLPYGLGWFVQEVAGTPIVWHYGWWPDAFSALLVKVPEQDVTLVLLANSDGLSAPFDLGEGDVLRSPFAVAFLEHFTTIQGGEG